MVRHFRVQVYTLLTKPIKYSTLAAEQLFIKQNFFGLVTFIIQHYLAAGNLHINYGFWPRVDIADSHREGDTSIKVLSHTQQMY